MRRRVPGRLIAVGDGRGREWILPMERVGKGLALYQPTRVRARAMRAALSATPRFLIPLLGPERRLADVLGAECESYIRARFPGDEYLFSVFMGTPSLHRKATIQVFTQSRIVAYCKVSTSREVGELFRHESELLGYLSNCGVTGIPQSLAVEKVGNSHVFVQDTQKSFHSRYSHRVGAAQVNFIDQLNAASRVSMRLEDTDFFSTVMDGLSRSGVLGEESRGDFEWAADTACKELAGEMHFCAAHRDFAPWNTCLLPAGLFVFDFEYGRRYYPPHLDLHNFIVSVGLHSPRASNAAILQSHDKVFGLEGRAGLVACLADNISQYLIRGGEGDGAVVERYCSLLRCLRNAE